MLIYLSNNTYSVLGKVAVSSIQATSIELLRKAMFDKIYFKK